MRVSFLSIYGECDSDCSDLDFYLYDSSGNQVDSDTSPDAQPVVTAPSNGDFRLEVRMHECDHSSGCEVSIWSDGPSVPSSLWLDNGQMASYESFFSARTLIRGTCDSDCSDLDLYVYNMSGNLVAQDIDGDPYPVVAIPYDGTFRLEVKMHNCSHSQGCEAYLEY